MKRLSDFFKADELRPENRRLPGPDGLAKGDEVLSIEQADFVWSRGTGQPTLEDITLKITKGELICVLGRVGCGKSSLLSAIAGDLIRLDGTMLVTGSVSYAPQNPWYVSLSAQLSVLYNFF